MKRKRNGTFDSLQEEMKLQMVLYDYRTARRKLAELGSQGALWRPDGAIAGLMEITSRVEKAMLQCSPETQSLIWNEYMEEPPVHTCMKKGRDSLDFQAKNKAVEEFLHCLWF